MKLEDIETLIYIQGWLLGIAVGCDKEIGLAITRTSELLGKIIDRNNKVEPPKV